MVQNYTEKMYSPKKQRTFSETRCFFMILINQLITNNNKRRHRPTSDSQIGAYIYLKTTFWPLVM